MVTFSVNLQTACIPVFVVINVALLVAPLILEKLPLARVRLGYLNESGSLLVLFGHGPQIPANMVLKMKPVKGLSTDVSHLQTA